MAASGLPARREKVGYLAGSWQLLLYLLCSRNTDTTNRSSRLAAAEGVWEAGVRKLANRLLQIQPQAVRP